MAPINPIRALSIEVNILSSYLGCDPLSLSNTRSIDRVVRSRNCFCRNCSCLIFSIITSCLIVMPVTSVWSLIIALRLSSVDLPAADTSERKYGVSRSAHEHHTHYPRYMIFNPSINHQSALLVLSSVGSSNSVGNREWVPTDRTQLTFLGRISAYNGPI